MNDIDGNNKQLGVLFEICLKLKFYNSPYLRIYYG